MKPKTSLSIYGIGVLGALLLCSMTALVGYQIGTGTHKGAGSVSATGLTTLASVQAEIDSMPVDSVAANRQIEVKNELETEKRKAKDNQSKQEVSTLVDENHKLADFANELKIKLESEQLARGELESLVEGLKQQLHIDKIAYADLKVSLKESSIDMTNLRDELNFYRNILSPNRSGEGVQIDLFSLDMMDTPDRYQYNLTLMQMQRHDEIMKGFVDVEIEGIQDEVRKIVDVEIFGGERTEVSFKYYQRVQGVFDVPAGFKPTGVTVIFETTDGSSEPISQSFPWPATMSETVAN